MVISANMSTTSIISSSSLMRTKSPAFTVTLSYLFRAILLYTDRAADIFRRRSHSVQIGIPVRTPQFRTVHHRVQPRTEEPVDAALRDAGMPAALSVSVCMLRIGSDHRSAPSGAGLMGRNRHVVDPIAGPFKTDQVQQFTEGVGHHVVQCPLTAT